MNTTQYPEPIEYRTVRIPGTTDHAGQHLITVTLRWVCPSCGGRRAATTSPRRSRTTGSRRLACDGWTNPCGHIDFYTDVRRETHRSPLDRPASTTTPAR